VGLAQNEALHCSECKVVNIIGKWVEQRDTTSAMVATLRIRFKGHTKVAGQPSGPKIAETARSDRRYRVRNSG